MYGEGNCYDMTIKCRRTGRDDVCSMADNFCYYEVEYILDQFLGRDEYDIRELTPDPFPYSYFEEYLNTEKVQKALGAFVNFTSNNIVSTAFASTGDDDRLQGAVKDSRKLVDQGIYVVQYNGDADYICNWIGNEAVVAKIDPPGISTAGYTNISSSDDIVHGVVKQSDNFAFARIYESGHEVPFYQPLVSLEMFERVINGYDVATGKTKVKKGVGFKTEGPAQSTYREGNGTVQFKVLPPDATYNTETNQPNPTNSTKRSVDVGRSRRKRKNYRPMPQMANLHYMADFGGL